MTLRNMKFIDWLIIAAFVALVFVSCIGPLLN